MDLTFLRVSALWYYCVNIYADPKSDAFGINNHLHNPIGFNSKTHCIILDFYLCGFSSVQVGKHSLHRREMRVNLYMIAFPICLVESYKQRAIFSTGNCCNNAVITLKRH